MAVPSATSPYSPLVILVDPILRKDEGVAKTSEF